MTSAQSSDTQVTDAPAPFDFTDADVILRSAPGPLTQTEGATDFRAHKLLLSLASPIFRDMFAMPHVAPNTNGDSADWKGGLPVVTLSEQTRVLEALLRLCYPLPDPTIWSVEELGQVLEAAMKYGMQEAQTILKRDLRERAKNDPLHVFAMASCYGWDEETRRAARCCLRLPRDSLVAGDKGAVLARITGEQLARLLRYHKRAAECAAVPATSGYWIDARMRVYLNCASCHTPERYFPGVYNSKMSPGKGQRAARWWWDYMTKVAEIVRRAPLAELGSPILVGCTLKEAARCRTCCDAGSLEQFLVFVKELESEIHGRVSEAKF